MAQQSVKRNPYLVEYAGSAGRSATVRCAAWKGQDRAVSRAQRAEIRRKRLLRRRLMALAVTVLLMGLLLAGFVRLTKALVSAHNAGKGEESAVHVSAVADILPSEQTIQGIPARAYASHPSWTEDFLTVNEYSRPGDALGEVKNIFVHYTANKGTSAAQNRSYFEQLKDTHERSASAHFIIGYDGEIIQCVPLDEIAYAVQTRNNDSISIECCYLSGDGSFTEATYDSLLSLLDWLMETYGLGADDILRHYDCGGKQCPVYYVEHEDAWRQLKKDAEAL